MDKRGSGAHTGHRDQRRRAQPLNQPLPATWRWIKSLPAEVRPLSVLEHFPRIANMLARTWRDTPSLNSYMDSLLVDRRGGRLGFPNEVQCELMTLRDYFEGRFPASIVRDYFEGRSPSLRNIREPGELDDITDGVIGHGEF